MYLESRVYSWSPEYILGVHSLDLGVWSVDLESGIWTLMPESGLGVFHSDFGIQYLGVHLGNLDLGALSLESDF